MPARPRRSIVLALMCFAFGALAALTGLPHTAGSVSQNPAGGGRAPTGVPLVPLEESWLRWPLPASEQAYGAIDGQRLKGYVREVTAISRRSRDRGEQWRGRIQGRSAAPQTEPV